MALSIALRLPPYSMICPRPLICWWSGIAMNSLHATTTYATGRPSLEIVNTCPANGWRNSVQKSRNGRRILIGSIS